MNVMVGRGEKMIASVKKEFPALIVEGRRLGTCC